MRLAVTFMRANPPTIGHERVVKMMQSLPAIEQRIYLSPSHGSKSDPLDFDYKLKLMKKAFEGVTTFVSPVPQKNFFDMLKFVDQLGIHELDVVVGGDRYEDIANRFPFYNGRDYRFLRLRVHNAGDRDDSDTVSGMSASKMREAAKLNDHVTFERGLPHKLRSMSSDIMARVREGCQFKSLVSS
jgi:hypothetical protein